MRDVDGLGLYELLVVVVVADEDLSSALAVTSLKQAVRTLPNGGVSFSNAKFICCVKAGQ